MNNIVEAIMKARELAIKEGIRANTVLIDKEFARVLPFEIENNIYPPMICGLKAEICKDMPEGMGIVVFESDMRGKELVEVAHAKWEIVGNPIFDDDAKVSCSMCSCIFDDFYNYCPNCGARMDGAEDA